ncbi:alpha/beta hydrolase [Streptomyces murinus]|uniref:alpha/beta hydrolase n=1 Tax=Streptomyces murinus TaxID=33900 RepID=UPI00381CFB03
MAIGERAAAQPSRDREPRHAQAFVSPSTKGGSQPAESAVPLIALVALSDAPGTTRDKTFSASPAEIYEPSAPEPEEFESAEELTLDASQPRDFAEVDRISRRQLAADLDRPAPAPAGPTEVTLGISGSDTAAAGTTLADVLQGGEPESFENKNMPRLVRTVGKSAPEDIRRTNAYHLTRALALGAGLPCHILCYEPEFEGVGRMAVALGDVETATHVAVLVPGMGSSPANFDELVRHARDVHDECRRISPEVQVAVIAWQGYKAPRDFFREGKGEVSDDKAAKDGSRLLNVDMAHWRALWKNSIARTSASLPPRPQITVNGHSYGTTVVGYALMRRTQPGGITDAAKGALAGTTRELFRQVLALLPPTAVAKKRMQGESWTQALTEGGKKTLPIAEFAVDPSGLSVAQYLYSPVKSTITRSIEQARTAYKSEPLGGGEADNLVLFGSPGTGRRAQHLNLPPRHIYAAAHKNDPVSHLNYFSIDPTHIKYDPTGRVVRLKTEYLDDPALGWKKNRERAHTSYYDPATEIQPAREALTNLARVTTGKIREVTTYKKRTGTVLEGHKSLWARLLTNPPTNTPQPNRKKTEKEEGKQGIIKTRPKRATGETEKEGSTPRIFDRGFPALLLWKDWNSLTISSEEQGKLFSVYGVGIAAPKFMNISTEHGAIEVKFKKKAIPGGYRNGLYIVKLSGGETECYVHEFEPSDDVTIPLGFPEEGTVIVLALMQNQHPDIHREHIPEGKNKVREERLRDLGLYPFPLDLAAPYPEDFSLLKAMIKRQPWALRTAGHPAVAIEATINSVRRYFTEKKQENLSSAQRHLMELRKDYTPGADNLNNEGMRLSPSNRRLLEKVLKNTDDAYDAARYLEKEFQIFDSSNSMTVASEQRWITSGEVYFISVKTDGVKLEKKLGSGRAYALNDPASSFVLLPPECEFRETGAGGEVRCKPPLSLIGDHLPVLILVTDSEVIEVVSMDDQWHTVPFEKKEILKNRENVVGAILATKRSEVSQLRFLPRVLPRKAQVGRTLDPYPSHILSDGVAETKVEYKKIASLAQNNGAIDWRGLARSADPAINFLKELGVSERSVPVAAALLDKIITDPQESKLGESYQRLVATSKEYSESIERVRIFHYFEFPEQYLEGKIPSGERVAADLESKGVTKLTVGHWKEWEKANKIWSESRAKLEEAKVKYHSEVDALKAYGKAGEGTFSAAELKAHPSKGFKVGFWALGLLNLGVSLSGGVAEGSALEHTAAAFSTTAVAMSSVESSLSLLGKAKWAGRVGKFAPGVSLIANFISLLNNINKEERDGWAIAFDVAGITADLAWIAAIAFPALLPMAGPLGVLAAATSVFYMLYTMGSKYPLPDEFVKDFGEKVINDLIERRAEYRLSFHRKMEGLGIAYEKIAGVWNSSEMERSSNDLLAAFRNEVKERPVDKMIEGLSYASMDRIYGQLNEELYPTGRRPKPLNTTADIWKLYIGLMEYCIKKVSDASPGERAKLRKSSFSLKDWLSTDEAKPFIVKSGPPIPNIRFKG